MFCSRSGRGAPPLWSGCGPVLVRKCSNNTCNMYTILIYIYIYPPTSPSSPTTNRAVPDQSERSPRPERWLLSSRSGRGVPPLWSGCAPVLVRKCSPVAVKMASLAADPRGSAVRSPRAGGRRERGRSGGREWGTHVHAWLKPPSPPEPPRAPPDLHFDLHFWSWECCCGRGFGGV